MTTNHELAEQIEQLVRDHIAATRATAAAAVERAFATTQRAVDRPGASAAPGAPSRRRIAPRRASEEVAALGERFYAVLCRSPGEMATLASQVGASPRALHVAVARLKQSARVRAVGQRQHTRYFPMTTAANVVVAVAAAA